MLSISSRALVARKTEIPHDEEHLDLEMMYFKNRSGSDNGAEEHMHLAPPQYDEMSVARSDISHAAVEGSELESWELWLGAYTMVRNTLPSVPIR